MAKKKVTSTSGLTDADFITLDYVAHYNGDEVKAALNQALARAMEKVGLLAEGYAKRLCPVDTGRLRNSITHQLHLTEGEYAVIVGTNVEYGPHVELGTHGKDGSHFLRKAAQDHAATYRKVIEGELQG